MTTGGPIGVFDSGYGGLTVLAELQKTFPDYDFLYLGDNARSPYGGRSFEVVYRYTLEAVEKLFDMGSPLVILACNTASAKALRTIQQKNLPLIDPERRVLGVIRPSVEVVGHYTKTGYVGIVGTVGTVLSNSYPLELEKFFPHVKVEQEACPLWVPLIENDEHLTPGAAYFVKKNLDNLFARQPRIDTLILGCTHYPIMMPVIREYVPQGVTIISQGIIVAESLRDYLNRHPEMDRKCSRMGTSLYYTTESPEKFNNTASFFLGKPVEAGYLNLGR
jgi:glutamate racemase